jgi:hypothetical protein|tara:strand:+ start:2921 stop:3301 length:381 start_codon:yes stop_codon:yes gene_type:complete
MKKSNLIGHNRPPRKHNYPKNRKPPKNRKGIVETIYGIDDRPWRLPEPEVFLKMNQKTRNKLLNNSWRHWKAYADKHKKWEKRMKRLDKTIERHRQKEEQRLEQKRIKDSKKKVKNRPRDITWISY